MVISFGSLHAVSPVALASASGHFFTGLGQAPSCAELQRGADEMAHLFNDLAATARGFPKTHFSTSIRALQSARQAILTGADPDVIDFTLDGAMHELVAVTANELHLFPPVDRIMVVSALEAVAKLTLRNNGAKRLPVGEDVPRVAELYRSAAQFLNFVDQEWHHEASLDPLEVFEQELLLASVLLSSRGRLNSKALKRAERQQIAAHWTRIGSAAAALFLHEQGIPLPNLAAAFTQCFGIPVELYGSQMFFPVHIYFEDVGAWRGDSSGDVDAILSEWIHELEAESSQEANYPYAYRRLLSATAPLSADMREQLLQLYGPAAPEMNIHETLPRFLAAIPTVNSELSRGQLALTDFLSAARR